MSAKGKIIREIQTMLGREARSAIITTVHFVITYFMYFYNWRGFKGWRKMGEERVGGLLLFRSGSTCHEWR